MVRVFSVSASHILLNSKPLKVWGHKLILQPSSVKVVEQPLGLEHTGN
jgi:hypothetical protein